jgi:hypothetical protein
MAFGHVLPQLPQFDTVLSDVSQPLRGLLSQLLHPLLQVGAHTPPEQLSVPWSLLQAEPQAPHWVTSVARFASQPLAASPSQLAKPGEQDATAQLPPTQLAVPLAATHTLPQKPQ